MSNYTVERRDTDLGMKNSIMFGGRIIANFSIMAEDEALIWAITLNQETAALRAELVKAQADLAAAQAIIIDAGKQVEALKAENARMGEILKTAFMLAEVMEAEKPLSLLSLHYWKAPFDAIQKEFPSLQPAPETPAKRATRARCRVNWNKRGFSSGSYEVLGHSNEKQAYMLNISTDENKPMLKMVRMADCEAAS